jgi:hypothetical protein
MTRGGRKSTGTKNATPGRSFIHFHGCKSSKVMSWAERETADNVSATVCEQLVK